MLQIHVIALTFFVLSEIGFHVAEAESSVFCSSSMFECHSDSECIPAAYHCNRVVDCVDGSDEEGCEEIKCPVGSFICESGQCILGEWECDGENDCKDGSDERNCTTTNCTQDRNLFSCGVDQVCIPLYLRCDGNKDCPNGTDEDLDLCSKIECEKGQFKCSKTHSCISDRWVCDGHKDCEDGSDEKNCAKRKCYFSCEDTGKCLDNSKICDGTNDCADESDESDCGIGGLPPARCSSDEFFCIANSECIPNILVCDDDHNCPGGTDEMNCLVKVKCLDDEFRCRKNGNCISNLLLCNGDEDCEDGSDEQQCKTSRVCNELTEFNCSQTEDSICIPLSEVCDNFSNCPRSEDENKSFCSNRTLCKNVQCQHGVCVQVGPRTMCKCDAGFQLSPSKTICEDVNECLKFDSCSQNCTNTEGSFKCSCDPNYELDRVNHKVCIAKAGDAKLMFAVKGEVRSIELRGHTYTSVIEKGRQIKAIEVDYGSRTFFIANPIHGTIQQAKFGQKTGLRLIWQDLKPYSLEDIVYDWVYKNLYVVTHHQIDMLNLHEDAEVYHRSIVNYTTEKRFHSAVVDPRNNRHHLYRTVLIAQNSMIERSHLDGSMVTPFVSFHSSSLTCLTIDFETNSMYWMDAKLHKISRKSLDHTSTEVDLVFMSYAHLKLPFAMDFFESRLYWSDQQLGGVYSLDITLSSSVNPHNKNVTVIKDGLENVTDVRVFHEFRQPEVKGHACEDHKCSHICLPSTNEKIKYQCLCPENTLGSIEKFVMDKDGIRCIEIIKDPRRSNATSSKSATRSKSNSSSNSTTSSKSTSNKSTSSKYTSSKSTKLGIGLFVTILIATAVVMMVILRKMRKRNTKAMNFTNPVYRKQQTDDDFMLTKNNQSLSAVQLLHVSEVGRTTLNGGASGSENV